MTLPAPFVATLDAMSSDDRAALLARADAMTSPAQMWTVAWHLMHGDADSASLVSFLPGEIFARYDDAMALAFSMGKLDRGER